MKQSGFLLVIFLCTFSSGAGRFILESEMRTDFNGATTHNFLTAYTYDAQGNRVLSRVWDGIDSLSAPMSRCSYTYNASDQITEAVLFSQAGDTLSIIRYTYTTGGLQNRIRVLNKDLTLRYSDSLIYDGSNRLAEMRRSTASAALAFYHRYAYDGSGRQVTDSLYEPAATSGFDPTQVVSCAYNGNGTVNAEGNWRIVGSQAYLTSTVKFGYANALLISATTYEGDGTGNRMMDSLAYSNEIRYI